MKCYNPSTVFGNEYPCGYCYACKLNYGSMWGQRMMNETKLHEKNVFVTLTYNEDNLPKDGKLKKRDVQLFLKRLRKKSKVRYYLAGEYGDKNKRPHYHAVLFGLGVDDGKKIDEAWGMGFTSCGDVTVDSCNYVAGYITKKIKGNEKREFEIKNGKAVSDQPFAIMSRNPGIGAGFIDRWGKEILARGYAYVKGNRVPIPRYYVNRITEKDEGIKGIVENSKYIFQKEKRLEKKKTISEIGYENNDKKALDERTARGYNVRARLKMKERKI